MNCIFNALTWRDVAKNSDTEICFLNWDMDLAKNCADFIRLSIRFNTNFNPFSEFITTFAEMVKPIPVPI